MPSYATARKNMVDCQIKPNKVTDDTLLQALENLPREEFVPPHMQGFAYIDEDIDLGNGRYMQEPMVLARLIQEAHVGKDDVVLDIGCGSGYSTAVLSCMASTVVGIEQDERLAAQADEMLKALDLTNTVIFQSDLIDGYAEQAPYDVIFINGSIPSVPPIILEQLVDGGRLVTVIAEQGAPGQAVVYTRVRDVVSEKVIFDAATPFLKEFEQQDHFVF